MAFIVKMIVFNQIWAGQETKTAIMINTTTSIPYFYYTLVSAHVGFYIIIIKISINFYNYYLS